MTQIDEDVMFVALMLAFMRQGVLKTEQCEKHARAALVVIKEKGILYGCNIINFKN